MKREVGRVLLGKVTLVEYEDNSDKKNFFVQCGIAGFYASGEELHDLYAVLNYYSNIDAIDDIVVSIKGD